MPFLLLASLDSAYFESLVEGLSVAFSNWLLIAGLAVGLLIFAVFCYLWVCASIFGPLQTCLKQATKQARELPVQNLIENFNAKAAKPKGPRVTRNFWELWQKFSRRCYSDPVHGVWYTPEPVEDGFLLESLLRGTRIAFFRHLPGYLLSVGLMLTFMGIALVIFRASMLMGQSGSDSEQVPQLLSVLLANASAKFWTSLAGLLASTIFAILFRGKLQKLESQLADFCEWMHGSMQGQVQHGFVRPDLGYLSNLMLQAQTSQQDMLAGIVVDMRRAFDGSLSTAADKFAKVADTLGSKIGEANAEGISNLVNEISVRLGKELEGLMGTVRESMADAAERLQGVVAVVPAEAEKLQKASVALESSFGTVADKISNSAGAAAATLSEALAGAGGHLKEINREAGEAADKLGQALGELGNTAETISALVEAIRSSTSGMKVAESSLGETSKRFSDAGGSVEAAVKRMQELQNASAGALDTAASRLAESANRLSTDLQGIDGRPMKDLGIRMQELLSSAENLRHAVVQMAGSDFKRTLKIFEEASVTLSNAVNSSSHSNPLRPTLWARMRDGITQLKGKLGGRK